MTGFGEWRVDAWMEGWGASIPPEEEVNFGGINLAVAA
jgi:hypothetical protein